MTRPFTLPEKGEFSRENLRRELTGKVVCVSGLGKERTGVLVHYDSGNLAVLNPHVKTFNGKPVIIEDICVIERPTILDKYDCETLQEAFDKYIKPAKERKAGGE